MNSYDTINKINKIQGVYSDMKFLIILFLVAIVITVWQYFKNDDKDGRYKSYGKTKTSHNHYKKSYTSAKEKGDLGEITIRELILNDLDTNERMLNNYITHGTSSKTSQIDHIVIKPSGVYIIETKNFEGKILGRRDDFEWLQVLAGGYTKNKFYNPVKQNISHINNIKKYIGENTPVYSMIVFLKADINNIARIDEVYTPHRMMLKFKYSKNDVILSNEEIIRIYNNLKCHKLFISDEEHVKNVNDFA